MIKYVEFDAFDEYGQHIIPVDAVCSMNKTASTGYSPELMKVILALKRRDDRYYVVVNALGSSEVWGSNKNGDGFPEVGLKHKSLRTDMGTTDDYGYKTFEYYAKLFKHHVNKDPKRSFGEVLFAHWNSVLHRVELIVAINTATGKDIIKALEANEQVGVSMGAKVRYDRCSICGNKAKTRTQYCKHLKNYMGRIVSKEKAAQWSLELGKTILPGSQVFAYNDHPRFFDISKVYVGADRTAFILGKAASNGIVIASVDMAEAYGMTDEVFDKIAEVGKEGAINKIIGGPSTNSSIDGKVIPTSKTIALKKAIDENVKKTISEEPVIPSSFINSITEPKTIPLSHIVSTLFGLGIHPKPTEFQRIVLVSNGQKSLADELDKDNLVFDYKDDKVKPQELDISNNNFNDMLGRLLIPFLKSRSAMPNFLEPRINAVMIKTSEAKWLDPVEDPDKGESKITPIVALAGVAALYATLKAKAAGYGPKQFAEIWTKKPWLRILIGGSIINKILEQTNAADVNDPLLRPASDYADILQDTNFSGHITKQGSEELDKTAKFKPSAFASAMGRGAIAGTVLFPSAYIINSYNQRSLYNKGKPLFPGAGLSPKTMAIGGGVATVAGSGILSKGLSLAKKVVKIK